MGGDLLIGPVPFQSALPVRGATETDFCIGGIPPNFNPRSPCGERRVVRVARTKGGYISIHAPLAGSDVHALAVSIENVISIHAPLAGSDYMAGATGITIVISIHAPLAGSDRVPGPWTPDSRYFNPRSPCGERPRWTTERVLPLPFQSTLPLRGATSAPARRRRGSEISIHAPLAGSDSLDQVDPLILQISIHAPLAGSDAHQLLHIGRVGISIHAPLAGSDWYWWQDCSSCRNFNPRSPCGERPGS
mgnify:CR=1 FL=1